MTIYQPYASFTKKCTVISTKQIYELSKEGKLSKSRWKYSSSFLVFQNLTSFTAKKIGISWKFDTEDRRITMGIYVNNMVGKELYSANISVCSRSIEKGMDYRHLFTFINFGLGEKRKNMHIPVKMRY